MERIGVISRVNQPTEWCVGIMVVPKASGKVRICTLTSPNSTSPFRERGIHYLPSSRPWHSWQEQSSSPNLVPTRSSGKYPLTSFIPSNNLHHTLLLLLLPSLTNRHLISARALPAADVRNADRLHRSGMHDERCSHSRHHTRRA